MKVIYYMEFKRQDLKLRVNVNPLMDGASCVAFDITGITLINFREEFVLSQYSSLYRNLVGILENDDMFSEVIEQVYLEEKNDRELDEALIGCNYD